MRSLNGLFDEFAAALQFPWYFGENADAFEDCLSDLNWLPPGAGYVVMITQPAEVLKDAGEGAFQWFVEALERTSQEWAHPVQQGEWWDRPAIPFHVVLQVESPGVESASRRWAVAGAQVSPFPCANGPDPTPS